MHKVYLSLVLYEGSGYELARHTISLYNAFLERNKAIETVPHTACHYLVEIHGLDLVAFVLSGSESLTKKVYETLEDVSQDLAYIIDDGKSRYITADDYNNALDSMLGVAFGNILEKIPTTAEDSIYVLETEESMLNSERILLAWKLQR